MSYTTASRRGLILVGAALCLVIGLLLAPQPASAHFGWHGFTRMGPLTSVLVYGSIPALVGIIVLMKVRYRETPEEAGQDRRADLQALKQRYTRGEIDRSQYEKQRRRLRRDG